jgi:hypothetical protein
MLRSTLRLGRRGLLGTGSGARAGINFKAPIAQLLFVALVQAQQQEDKLDSRKLKVENRDQRSDGPARSRRATDPDGSKRGFPTKTHSPWKRARISAAVNVAFMVRSIQLFQH